MPAEFCSESLQADVSTDLRAIWSTIGVPEDAQQAQIQELSGKIAALLRGAVQHEEGRQGQLKEEVERIATRTRSGKNPFRQEPVSARTNPFRQEPVSSRTSFVKNVSARFVLPKFGSSARTRFGNFGKMR